MLWYEIVSRTDHAFTSATFGLARCLLAQGARGSALAAYDRVPESSSSYADAQIARIRCLIASDDGHEPDLADLRSAAAGLESLHLDDEQRARLTSELLEKAGALVVERGTLAPDPDQRLLGFALTERDLRAGLEQSYRELAWLAKASSERIRLVDLANEVRPRTWT